MRPANLLFLLTILALFVALALTPACASLPPLVTADGTPDGKAIYEQRCGSCHALRDPATCSDEEWARNVATFAARAGIRPSWRPAVIAYLQSANDGSRRTPPMK